MKSALQMLVTALLLALAAVPAAQAQVPAEPQVPAESPAPEAFDPQVHVDPAYRERVAAQLERAGANRDELVRFLAGTPESRRKAAAFIVAYLPLADLVGFDAEALRENLDYAYKARETFPWAADVPQDVFLHYVLPHRASEEPPARWRRYLFEQVGPQVQDARDLREAAWRVNRWLGTHDEATGRQRVRFVQTEARDQGVLETLLSGYGRCEEEMIAYICAARAVGVPVRAVWTPWWATGDSNHAWCEVWADGQWFPLGACEPGPDPDLPNCWFSGRATRACAVYSTAYGIPQAVSGGELYETQDQYVTINNIALYSKACRLTVEVRDAQGAPQAGVPVAVSVFNFGAFRSFGEATTDAQGRATLLTGVGDYLLTAGPGELQGWAVVAAGPGEQTEALTLWPPDDSRSAPRDYVFLRYPTDQESRDMGGDAADADKIRRPRRRHPRPMPSDRLPAAGPEAWQVREFKPEEHPDLMALLDGNPHKDGVVSALQGAAGNWPELAAALRSVRPELRQDLGWFIAKMPHLDRLEARAWALADHVQAADQARRLAAWTLDDAVWRGSVLDYELSYVHFAGWRGALWAELGHLQRDTAADTARAANEWVAAHLQVRGGAGGRYANVLNPLAVYRAGGASAFEVNLFTVGLLRTLGVPARRKGSWTEFQDVADGAWKPLYPTEPQGLGDPAFKAESRTAYEQPGGVRVEVIRDGKSDPAFQHLGISEWRGGQWVPRRDISMQDGFALLPAGRYLVTAGARNANGDAWVFARAVNVESGKGTAFTVVLDPPPHEAVAAATPASGQPSTPPDAPPAGLPDIPLADLRDPSLRTSVAGLSGDGPVLLAFFSLRNEPSIRMMPMLEQLREPAAAAGAVLAGVFLDDGGLETLRADGRLAGLSYRLLSPVQVGDVEAWIPDLAAKPQEVLPAVFLLDGPTLRVRFKSLGYNLNLAEVLERELAQAARAAYTGPGPAGHPHPGLPGTDTDQDAMRDGPMPEPVVERSFDLGQRAEAQKASQHGVELLQQGLLEDAVVELQRAVELQLDLPGAHYNLACALARLHRLDEALASLARSIELGYREFGWIRQDPDLEDLRRDPEFGPRFDALLGQ